MKTRSYLLLLMEVGPIISVLLTYAYFLTAYRIVSGKTLIDVIHTYSDNTLLYFGSAAYMLWYISILFKADLAKICKKYGVDVIR